MKSILKAITLCQLAGSLFGNDYSAVSSKGTYLVRWQVPANQEVPLNKAFDIEISVLRMSDHKPADIKLSVSALMPMHNHGMNVEPEIVHQEPGHWRARGLNLYMPGEWQFLFGLSTGSSNEFAASTITVAEDCANSTDKITADEARKYLSLFSYQNAKPDTTNIYANDPTAARFGEILFYEPRLSGSGTISCASCHRPNNNWTDGRDRAIGISQTNRNTPSLWNVAHRRWLFWDGRASTLWSQALAPIEAAGEMGGNRAIIARLIRNDDKLRDLYTSTFGRSPTRTSTDLLFANVGKAIGAFETTLVAHTSRFDQFLSCLEHTGTDTCRQLRPVELTGLRIFTGRAGCSNCHHGSDLTDEEFHDILLPRETIALGRSVGLAQARADHFGPSSKFSDDTHSEIALLLRRTQSPTNLEHAFRTPSLRNVKLTAPYMHNGMYPDLSAVLQHYSTLSDAPVASRGDPLIRPLHLTPEEKSALLKFLVALGTR